MKYETLADVIRRMSSAMIEEDVMHDRYMRVHGKKAQGKGMWAFTTKRAGEPSDSEMHIVAKNINLGDAAKEAMKALNSKSIYVMEETQLEDHERSDVESALVEDRRALARAGIGAHKKNEVKTGQGVDYFHPKDGSKRLGVVKSMSHDHYKIKDDDDGREHKFKYYSPMKEDSDISEQRGKHSAAYSKGFSDGVYGQRDPRASSYGPSVGDYDAGFAAGVNHEKQQKQQRAAKYKSDIAPYMSMSLAKLNAAEQKIKKEMDQISTIARTNKAKFTPELNKKYQELLAQAQNIHQAKFQKQQPTNRGAQSMKAEEKLPVGVEMHYTHPDPKKKPTKVIHFSVHDAMRGQKEKEKEGYRLSHKKAVYAKEDVNEKKLTSAEMKKREEVAMAIKRDQPGMAMDKKMAIATATAKRVAESNTDENSLNMKESIKKGDFVKDRYGTVHRVFDVRDNTLHTGEYRGNNKYGGTSMLHKGNATKVSTPKDAKEDYLPTLVQTNEARGGEDEPDKHIIMQLRSAQDLDGKKDIKFRGGKTGKVAKQHIDKILRLHDHPSMKPVNKRLMRVAISKSPQHLAQFADKIKENFTVEQMEPIFEYMLNNPSFQLYEEPYKVPSNYTAMMQKKKKQDIAQQMADKAKKDNITQSDKEKLSKLSAMMRKEQATEKEVKMAKGVAFDKRYKGGNYDGAAKTIEKIRKGLSDHPSVKNALRRANENSER